MSAVPTTSTTLRTSLLTVLLWYGVVLLPFDFLPLRFESHETHRAGMTLVIAVGLMVVMLIPRYGRRLQAASPLEKFFLASLAFFIVVLILSTLFALSPMQALVGDLIRRMGLLTQLALVMLVFAVREVDWRVLARGFWFAGVICAVYALLQFVGWIPNPIEGRAFGTLGAPTFTASWLVNALIWSLVWVLSEAHGSIWRRTILVGGPLVMVAALLATGGRGALLALILSGVTGYTAFAWVKRRRALLILIAGVIVIVGGGLFALSQIDWQNSTLADWPLISRLNPTLPDTPRAVREHVWGNALVIFARPPRFVTVDGQSDPFYELRRWFGYGQDHFEIVHRPYVDDNLRAMEQGRPIDRVHNVIFDLLVMQGAVGVIAWLSVWLTGAAIALRQLYRARQSRPSLWVPLLILTIMVAHVVDLSFSFETLAGGWAAWLALGLVLRTDTNTEPSESSSTPALFKKWWLISSFFVSLFVGRGLSPLSSAEAVPIGAILILLVVIALSTMTLQSASWRSIPAHVGSSVTGIILGLLIGRLQSADGAALTEILLFSSAILAMMWSFQQRITIDRTRHSRLVVIPVAVAMIAAASYWFSETRAQIHFSLGIAPGMLSASTVSQAELHKRAALDFPLDAKLQMYAAIALYQAAVNRIDGVDQVMLTEAQDFGEASIRLKPYDAEALRALAEIEYAFASLVPPDDALHFQLGLQLEDAASRLLRPEFP
jgi:O-antigen ligase